MTTERLHNGHPHSQQIEDPRTRFHSSSFPQQEQEQPATTDEVTPQPDHGEEKYRGSDRLAGHAALITGGDSGIGRAVAIAYAREGADVAIVYMPEEREDARATHEAVTAAGRKCLLLEGDVRSEEFCTNSVEETLKEFGKLTILVLNAGYQKDRDGIENLPTEEF